MAEMPDGDGAGVSRAVSRDGEMTVGLLIFVRSLCFCLRCISSVRRAAV
jgi:c-di-GMP-related signal transduction protein